MDPVFFPFTFITESMARDLRACFDRIVVFMPSGLQVPKSMRLMGDRDWLSMVTPFKTGDVELGAFLKNYREWADLHGPRHLRQIAEQVPNTPFYDDSSVYRLFEEINTRYRDPGSMKKQSSRRSEFIFQSRIFLLIAQEFDQRTWALRQDLATVESMAHDLFKNLHAKENGFAIDQPRDGLYREGHERSFMLLERLTAWSCFLFEEAASAKIFITTSQPIVDRLIKSIPGVETVLSVNKIPVRGLANAADVKWRKNLRQWLAKYSDLKETGEEKVFPHPPEARNGEATLSLMVYRADQAPDKWFGTATGVESLFEEAHGNGPNEKATLLAHVKVKENNSSI